MLQASIHKERFCTRKSVGIRLESMNDGAVFRINLIGGDGEEYHWRYITKCEELGFDKSNHYYGNYKLKIRKV